VLGAVEEILEKVDRPEPQVTIAAEIVETSLDVDDRVASTGRRAWRSAVPRGRPRSLLTATRASGTFIPPMTGLRHYDDEFGD